MNEERQVQVVTQAGETRLSTACAASSIPAEYKSAVNKCLAKYATYTDFVDKLSPKAVARLLPQWEDAMIYPLDLKGEVKVPTVYVASLTFGREPVMAWLMAYVVDVNSFFLGSSTDKKMTPAQMEEAASVLMQNYGNLLVSEPPVIFSRIKGGRYGKAYGVVDGGMLCNCFQQYMEGRMEERAMIHKRMEAERIKRRNAEWSKEKSMSFDEFKDTVAYAKLQMSGKAQEVEDFVNKFDLKVNA